MAQKRQISLIVFGVVLLLFIAGCNSGGDTPGGAPTTPFLGGSQGLDISFLQGNPPDEVIDTAFPFRAIVRLQNQGEFDLKMGNVSVSLTGFLASQFKAEEADLKNQPPEDDPSPRQRDSEGNIIEPIETFVTFPPNSKDPFTFVGNIRGNTPFTFRAEVCYKYQTEAVSELCVLENMIDVADGAICNPSGSKSVFSSGSPIGVTSFRQNVVGKDKLQFSFDIVHSGTGDVFQIDVIDAARRKTAEDAVEEAENAVQGIGDPEFDVFKSDPDPPATSGLLPDARIAIISIPSLGLEDAKTKLEKAKKSAVNLIDNFAEGSSQLNALNIVIVEMGNALDALTIRFCPKSPTDRRKLENRVNVDVNTGITSGTLKCGVVAAVPNSNGLASGTVNLVNGGRTITCTQDLSPGRSDFVNPVDIVIDFDYFESTDKNVLVKKLG